MSTSGHEALTEQNSLQRPDLISTSQMVLVSINPWLKLVEDFCKTDWGLLQVIRHEIDLYFCQENQIFYWNCAWIVQWLSFHFFNCLACIEMLFFLFEACGRKSKHFICNKLMNLQTIHDQHMQQSIITFWLNWSKLYIILNKNNLQQTKTNHLVMVLISAWLFNPKNNFTSLFWFASISLKISCSRFH